MNEQCHGCALKCGAAANLEVHVFHQPADHTSPFSGHQTYWLQPHASLTWSPNQPGRELDPEAATSMVWFLKERYWDSQPERTKEIYDYMQGDPSWTR